MTWDPPGLWASGIISIMGGFAAGALVLAGEVLIRRGYERVQRGKAERAIGIFFREWETAINNVPIDIPSDPNNPNLGPIARPEAQFAQHRLALLMAQNIVARWSRYLTAEQVQNVSNLLQIEELVTGTRLSGGRVWDLDHYDVFFRQVRGIEWLDF